MRAASDDSGCREAEDQDFKKRDDGEYEVLFLEVGEDDRDVGHDGQAAQQRDSKEVQEVQKVMIPLAHGKADGLPGEGVAAQGQIELVRVADGLLLPLQ